MFHLVDYHKYCYVNPQRPINSAFETKTWYAGCGYISRMNEIPIHKTSKPAEKPQERKINPIFMCHRLPSNAKDFQKHAGAPKIPSPKIIFKKI